MTELSPTTLARDYAAALDWWQGAGVDCDFADEPRGWLRVPEVEEAPPPQPPPRTVPRQSPTPALDRALHRAAGPPIGGDAADWPRDLAAFRRFWLTEPGIDPIALSARVAPRGEAGAALMALVCQPDDEDRDDLLTGEQGAWLAHLRRAMGLPVEAVYVASLLPRVTPEPDWDDLAGRGLATLTGHHIGLVTPTRLITFGEQAARFSQGSGVPVLNAPSLARLGTSPGQRRKLWTQWLAFSA